MSNIFNEDFRDFLTALNEADVKYILVGGFLSFYTVIPELPVTWIFG